ncbi:MAG: acyl-CoA dehydrogenase [bacterium]|nr:acyl-CoA dehydrogenase [bacterium]
MDFALSKEHEMMRKLFSDFAQNEVKPLAQEVDETEEFPRETTNKMAKLGFLGIPVPKEYGGQGCDVLAYAMCVEELSKVCGTTGVIVSAHTSLCIDPIMTYGTEEQKQKYVVPLAKGEKLGAFGLTEPGAGTDAQGQQTKAVLDGDEYVINGSKIFITNGKEADVYVIFAITGVQEDARGRKKKLISAFIVEKGTPGFTFGTKEKKMGIRGSSTYELIFTDCRIPKENMLGKEGKGFGIAMHTLDGGRIGIAAQALGLAEGALESTIAYVKERKQFGKAIGSFQNTQFQIADMATKVKAAQLLVYRAAIAKSTQKVYSEEAAMAKLYAAEVAMEVTTKAVQLHGGYGYTREYDVERMMRDAKITEIYEGTSEVQRMVISANVMK